MSDEVRCPACHVAGPLATRIGNVAVCGACGESIVFDINGSVRKAMAADLDVLSPRDRALLVKARSAIARPRVK